MTVSSVIAIVMTWVPLLDVDTFLWKATRFPHTDPDNWLEANAMDTGSASCGIATGTASVRSETTWQLTLHMGNTKSKLMNLYFLIRNILLSSYWLPFQLHAPLSHEFNLSCIQCAETTQSHWNERIVRAIWISHSMTNDPGKRIWDSQKKEQLKK